MPTKNETKYPNGKLKSIITFDGEYPHGPAEIYFENGKLKDKYNYVNGAMHGERTEYNETGNIQTVTNWINGVQKGLATRYNNDGSKMRESTVIDGLFEGDQTEWWSNGIIKAKRFYKKNIVINLTEWDNLGNLTKESVSEILIQTWDEDDGMNDVFFGSELSLKEWKKGSLIKEELQYEYEKPENIKGLDGSLDSNGRTNQTTVEKNIWWSWSLEKHKKYSSVKTFYENGKLKTQTQFLSNPESFRHAPNQYEVSKYLQGPFKEYFPSGNIMCEGNYKLNAKNGLCVFYFETGKIKSEQIFNWDICESLKEWDENGMLIKEVLLKDGDSRTVIMHEVMTKGNFSFELKDGTQLNVFGQRHQLVEIEEFYEDGEWAYVDGERNPIDEFHLTGYEEGFMYDEDDLYNFFDLPEDTYPEWDFNGWGDWEETEQDWDDFKSQFPTVNSKEQFRIN